MQHTYNIHKIYMQPTYNVRATHIQYICNTLQHTYNTYATHKLRDISKKRRGLKMKSWPAMRKLFSSVENK